MKVKEYLRLSKLSLKERSKNTHTTVAGLAFGFIILLPIIVCLLGVNISFNKQLNEKPYLLYYNVSKMTDYRIEIDNYKNSFVSGSKNIDYFDNDKLITNKIVYETDKLISDFNNTTKLKINDGDYIPINQLSVDYFNIIDMDKSDSYFPENLLNNTAYGIFLDSYDKGFTNDGKKQVIVSERMLAEIGIKADDIYQKQLTISSDSYQDSINNQEEFSGYICKDYTVVGIIREEISMLYDNDDFMCANLFFTSINVYENQAGMLKPYFTEFPQITTSKDSILISRKNEYTYDNYHRKEELNEEYMMLGSYGKGDNSSGLTFFSTNVYVESNNYTNLNSSYGKLEKHIDNILQFKQWFPLQKSLLFEKYQFIYELVMYASSVFIIISCIIIFSAMINTYVTIKHSTKQRAFYLTMLRAIGARDNVLPKLYMTESFIIVSMANLLIATIGLAVTVVVKFFIDKTLAVNNIIYNLSISWSSVFISLFLIIGFLYLFAFFVSYLSIYKLSKKPIMSILNEK